jgi:hypothetical protein
VVLALSVPASCSLGCGSARHVEPDLPPFHQAPPDEIIVRTDHFAFHMGIRVDEAWAARADGTRAAVGRAAEVLLEDEDTTVSILSRQLGVEFPREPLDFDVALTAPVEPDVSGCDTKLPHRLELPVAAIAHPQPELFFACVLERAFTRLEPESVLARAMGAGRAGSGDGRAGPLYACVVQYAVGTMLVARAHDAKVSRRLEVRLGEVCSERELDWLGKEWVKRVREDESAEAFGARAAKEASVNATPAALLP